MRKQKILLNPPKTRSFNLDTEYSYVLMNGKNLNKFYVQKDRVWYAWEDQDFNFPVRNSLVEILVYEVRQLRENWLSIYNHKELLAERLEEDKRHAKHRFKRFFHEKAKNSNT